jgi:hypothetical protein
VYATGAGALLGGLFLAVLLWPPTAAALKGTLDLQVARPKGDAKSARLMRLAEALPLRPGHDFVRIEAGLNRQAFVYLVWVDAAATVTLVYPSEEQRKKRQEPPIKELFWPSRVGSAKLDPGPGGTETLILLARDRPLPADLDVPALFKGLRVPASKPSRGSDNASDRATAASPMPFRGPTWFENGRLVPDETDSLAFRTRPRGAPREGESLPIAEEDLVLQFQALVCTRVKDLFSYSRAVSFSTAGDEH